MEDFNIILCIHQDSAKSNSGDCFKQNSIHDGVLPDGRKQFFPIFIRRGKLPPFHQNKFCVCVVCMQILHQKKIVSPIEIHPACNPTEMSSYATVLLRTQSHCVIQ